MTIQDQFERNRAVIVEFRQNAGKVGGRFAGASVLLLTTTGAKTGLQRTTPLQFLPDGERYLIFASKGGAPNHPAWYHNIVAHPTDITIEVGTETIPAKATVVKGAERNRLYAAQAKLHPNFAEYEKRTSRSIPVIALERRG